MLQDYHSSKLSDAQEIIQPLSMSQVADLFLVSEMLQLSKSDPQLQLGGTSLWKLHQAKEGSSDDEVYKEREFKGQDYMPDRRSSSGEWALKSHTIASTFQSSSSNSVLNHHGNSRILNHHGNSRITADRFCNKCGGQKTSKWYKDRLDIGKHICKKCYNYRYKERTKN